MLLSWGCVESRWPGVQTSGQWKSQILFDPAAFCHQPSPLLTASLNRQPNKANEKLLASYQQCVWTTQEKKTKQIYHLILFDLLLLLRYKLIQINRKETPEFANPFLLPLFRNIL